MNMKEVKLVCNDTDRYNSCNISYEFQAYVDWCGELVSQLNIDIPWVMCNG